jgi:levoglucosan dehydrogenase
MGEGKDIVRVGLVGAGFIARLHTLAYRSVSAFYGDAVPRVELVRIADIAPGAAEAAATRLGWQDSTTDWREVTQAEDIDLVDIATPNDAHAEIAIDAARHAKAILCEKPLAATVGAAREMASVIEEARVTNQVGFVFRKWPAVELAKKLIEDGRLGDLLSFRGHYFHDYALDPEMPISWRMQRERAGAGALGDIGSHILDLAHYLVGNIDRVMARTTTLITERPTPSGGRAEVDVDDAADLLLDFDGGATGSIHVNWASAGYKTEIGFDLAGTRGALRFRWQHSNELEFYSCEDPTDIQGFRPVIIGPEHPKADIFWPVPGLGIGYSDGFVLSVSEILSALKTGRHAQPDFAHGLRISEVIDAALHSAETGAWQFVSPSPVGGQA